MRLFALAFFSLALTTSAYAIEEQFEINTLEFLVLPYLGAWQQHGYAQQAYKLTTTPASQSIPPFRPVAPDSAPLWLHSQPTHASKSTWHTPALTPAMAAELRAERKRNARLAKKMADRAFYFGYDTNNDALK